MSHQPQNARLGVRQAVSMGVGAMAGAGIFPCRAPPGRWPASPCGDVLAITSAGVVLLTFVFTTLVQEPASAMTLLAIAAAASSWTWCGSGPARAGTGHRW